MKSNLFKPGFLSLLAAQFFGAMNDNVLKMVLTFMVIDGVWKGKLGEGGQGIVGVCFTLPFILLSGYGGQIADRHSKRDVTLWVKIAEIPIALIAFVGFYTDNLWITLTALIALTCQSSFFGPAKYGMIPEVVDESDLSRANGTINMMTNIAVIVGTLVGGLVADEYSPKAPAESIESAALVADGSNPKALAESGESVALVADGSNPEDPYELGVAWLPGAVLLIVALAGLAAVTLMPRLPPGDRSLRFEWNPFATYVGAIREMATSRFLVVMMAWGYFYLLAGLALLILPEYSEVLGVSRASAAALMGVMGIAIGIGCATAGLISGHHIEPRLIPVGAAGLTVFFALLGLVPPTVLEEDTMLEVAMTNVSMFVFAAGFFAGFYIIPLQALLQKLSPSDERGRFLGTANAVSFSFLTLASLLYFAIRGLVDEPQHIFLVSSFLMAVGAAGFLWNLRGTGILIGKRVETPAAESANR